MSNQAFTFDDDHVALWAANIQFRAVNGKINELLSLLYILADSLRASDETNVYASALGCVETVLETLYDDTLHEFVVVNEPTQAAVCPDNQQHE